MLHTRRRRRGWMDNHKMDRILIECENMNGI